MKRADRHACKCGAQLREGRGLAQAERAAAPVSEEDLRADYDLLAGTIVGTFEVRDWGLFGS